MSHFGFDYYPVKLLRHFKSSQILHKGTEILIVSGFEDLAECEAPE